MRNNKIYLKLLVIIIIILWIFYLFNDFKYKKEGFVNRFCRPYIRKLNMSYESFVNNYGTNIWLNKMKKWNIL